MPTLRAGCRRLVLVAATRIIDGCRSTVSRDDVDVRRRRQRCVQHGRDDGSPRTVGRTVSIEADGATEHRPLSRSIEGVSRVRQCCEGASVSVRDRRSAHESIEQSTAAVIGQQPVPSTTSATATICQCRSGSTCGTVCRCSTRTDLQRVEEVEAMSSQGQQSGVRVCTPRRSRDTACSSVRVLRPSRSWIVSLWCGMQVQSRSIGASSRIHDGDSTRYCSITRSKAVGCGCIIPHCTSRPDAPCRGITNHIHPTTPIPCRPCRDSTITNHTHPPTSITR